MIQAICVSCKKPFIKNPRQKKQRYCSSPLCQKARKALWQKCKMRSDPKYKSEQVLANKDWHHKNPDYWKNYRQNNPQNKLRNKLLQKKRNHIRYLRRSGSDSWNSGSEPEKMIAKMDVLKTNHNNAFTECWVIPVIAKMDVLKGYLSVNYDYFKRN